MLFGLCTAAQTLKHFMYNSFSDMDSVYVDDTVVADKSVEKHLLHLDLVFFARVTELGLVINAAVSLRPLICFISATACR